MQQNGLLIRYRIVLFTLDNEEWRIILINISNGTCPFAEVGASDRISADKYRDGIGRGITPSR